MSQHSHAGAGSLSSLPDIHNSLGNVDRASSRSSLNNRSTKPRTAPDASSRGRFSSPSSNLTGSPQRSIRARSAGSPAAATLAVAEYQTASADVLQGQVQLVQDAVCACQAAYNKARTDVNKCTERIKQLQQQVSSLEAEDKQLSVKVPLPVNRLLRVRQWLGERNAELAAERCALQGKQMALLKAESQLRARETEADLLVAAAGSLSSAAAGAASAALRDATAAHEVEVTAANQLVKRLQRDQQQAEQQEAGQQMEAARRLQAAQDGQAAAKQRLATSQAAMRAAAAEVDEAAAAEEQLRRQALLSLKGTIDNVRADIGKKAEKHRQLQKQKREQEKREFEALQEQGLNPYEVYRMRDAEAAASKAAAELAARQQQRVAEIAAALEEEDKEYRKQLKRQDYGRHIEEEYQRNMGIAAQQQRTDAYMRSHTLSGQSLLDPTSRMHNYPSQSTLVKPAGFGLGRSSPDAVNRVAARHPGMQQDLTSSLLLPSTYRQGLSGITASTGQQLSGVNEAENKTSSGPGLQGLGSGLSAAAAPGREGDRDEGADDDRHLSDSDGDLADEDPLSSTQCTTAAGARSTSRGPLHTAKLSKLEQDKLQQAKQAHKGTVAQPKTAFGRTFAGDAFIADPTEVLFKDFVPGTTYKTSVQLINRSFVKNSIRLLDTPAEVTDVIELDMPPSGGLATGASATLRVNFTPKVDGDLSASIPLLAETGPLSLPLRCLARRALPSVNPAPIVSLDGRAGGVMLAATAHKAVTISNAGALTILYDIKVTGALASTTEYEEPDPPLPPPNATAADMAQLHAKVWAATSLAVAGFKVQGTKGQVQGYGSSTFTVNFTPRVAGVVEVPLLVRFSAPENKSLMLSPAQLTLTATGKDLPVSTSTPLIDFKSVMYGQLYAAPLLLSNASKSAMKALVGGRPELNDWLTFTPDFGFIQADDTLSVSVSLKPTPEMKTRLSKFLLPESDTQQGVFEVPLQVTVPEQTLPIPFKLRFQPTTTDLYLSPSMLDFGRVPLNESAGVCLTITNPSLLPQLFSFGAKLPLGMTISPNSGYGQVLPGESLQLLVHFQPPISGLQYFGLTCRTLAGRLFKVEGKCEGLELDVALSHNSVKFPATEVNDTNSASVVLHNKGSKVQLFEFGVPAGSFVQVTPRVGTLKPNSSLRLQLDFAPPLALMQQDPGGPAASANVGGSQAGHHSAAAAVDSATAGTAGVAPSAAGGALQPAQQQQQQQDQPDTLDNSDLIKDPNSHWFWFRQWLLPCYTRPAGPQDDLACLGLEQGSTTNVDDSRVNSVEITNAISHQGVAGPGMRDRSSGGSSDSVSVLHLAVTTCAVAPELHLVSPQLPKPPGKNYFVLDFGALPVGERMTRQLELSNKGVDVVPLTCGPLDPAGIFTIVTALRPIEGNSTAKILLAFQPEACTEYYEALMLKSAKSRLRIALKGRGIAPTLSISPAAATSSTGGLIFGDVLLSDPTNKELTVSVTNTCPFTITYTTRFIGSAPKSAVAPSTEPPAAAAAAAAAGASAAASTTGSMSGAKPKPLAPGSQTASTVAGTAATAPAGAPATAGAPGQPSGCFYCKPSSGTLEAGQSQELTVVLAPTATGQGLGPLSPYVTDRLQILVPYQQQDVVLPLHANVWPDGVFVAGLRYSSSSNALSCNRAAGTASSTDTAAERILASADPFAAALAAAAAASAAAAAPAAPAAAKGKQTPAAASQPPASQQQQNGGLSLVPMGGMAAVLAAAGYCELTQGFVQLPSPIAPGQVSSVTLDFGAVKSSAGASTTQQPKQTGHMLVLCACSSALTKQVDMQHSGSSHACNSTCI